MSSDGWRELRDRYAPGVELSEEPGPDDQARLLAAVQPAILAEVLGEMHRPTAIHAHTRTWTQRRVLSTAWKRTL